ncbi:MAG: threonine/serine exporter family protein [bacterium]|nr:threonine/serine exporter family protein [bacterium]
MSDKMLMETAVLAGEIMLSSGAEIYRVEDTMNHILKMSDAKTADAYVLSTGVLATLENPKAETITVVRRVNERATNLNRICAVNDISRRFCAGSITLETAHRAMQEVEKVQIYKDLFKKISIIGVTGGFALLLGGSMLDGLTAGIVGAVLALVLWLTEKISLNDFCKNAIGGFVIAYSSFVLKQWVLRSCNVDLVVIGSIMPIVPGVTFTTAIRDTLNGDYSSGVARMVEAVVVALAVAAGVGLAMLLWNMMTGGSMLWS